MIRPSNDLDVVWLCRNAVDFRKGINGLSVLVEDQLVRDPFNGQLFVFVNRRRDKIKILYWERAGFCMWQKRLEAERFKWPEHLFAGDVSQQRHLDGDVLSSSSERLSRAVGQTIVLDGQQLNWLLDGYDLAAMRPHRSLAYTTVL